MDGCKTEELEAVAGNLETDGFYCLPPSQIRDERTESRSAKDRETQTESQGQIQMKISFL